MSSRYHGPLRWMGNFKAVQADYAYYLTLSDEPESVCLSERQRYLITVQNTYTYWATRWYNTDDVSEAELKTIAAEIEDLMMCGCGTPEPSITDRFTANTYMTTTNAFYEETYNTWNDAGQTVSSIAPHLDYDTGDPHDIGNLTCLSIEIFLTTIIQQAIAFKQQTGQQKRDITKNLGAVAAALATAGGLAVAVGGPLAALVAFLGGPMTLFVLAITAVGLAIATLVDQTDLSVFQDKDAIANVLCVMKRNMGGQTMTESVFQSGLTPNYFAAGGNSEKLAAIIQPYLDNQTVYLQFLVSSEGLYGASDVGALPDCDTCSAEVGVNTQTCLHAGQASGINVVKGIGYHSGATGTYIYNPPSDTTTADGMPPDPFTAGVEPTLKALILMAKIGSGGTYFAVGSDHAFTASDSGELYFSVNELYSATINTYADNVGILTVTIEQ